MSSYCSEGHCYAPDTTCKMGAEDHRQCPHWKEEAAPQEPGLPAGPVAAAFPWNGGPFGKDDAAIVAARGRPAVIGILGAEGAGKTTALGLLYSLLHGGRCFRGWRFAGSYTLGGWETIAHNLRWHGTTPPSFPPHTPRGAARVPGLLHLALRAEDGRLLDMLITDAPGEWFVRWAVQEDAAECEGARWVSEFATGLLVFADSEALAGPMRGEARSLLSLLIQRVGTNRRGRPTAAVWAKADIEVPERIRQSVEDTFGLYVGGAPRFAISAHHRADDRPWEEAQDRAASSLLGPFEYLVDEHFRRGAEAFTLGPSRRAESPFFTVR